MGCLDRREMTTPDREDGSGVGGQLAEIDCLHAKGTLSLRLNISRKEQRRPYLAESSWWDNSLPSEWWQMSWMVRMPLDSQASLERENPPETIHLLSQINSFLIPSSRCGEKP